MASIEVTLNGRLIVLLHDSRTEQPGAIVGRDEEGTNDDLIADQAGTSVLVKETVVSFGLAREIDVPSRGVGIGCSQATGRCALVVFDPRSTRVLNSHALKESDVVRIRILKDRNEELS